VTTAFTNTATADPATATCPNCENETAVNLANNTDSVTVTAGGPSIDLAVTSVQDFPDAVARGDTVTYTIVAVNGGTTTANNVKVRDTLTGNTGLGGLAVVSATASQGFACDNNIGDSMIECTGNLLAGQSTTITIVLQTQAGAPTSLTSTVKVDPDNAFIEADETNNERVEVTSISDSICTSCKDLVISAVLESSDPVADEGTLTYTVTVGNIGDQSTDTGAGNQALVFFDLGVSGGAQFEFVSETATAGFTCTQVTNTATSLLTDCSGELGPGQGTIITINVKAKSPGSITATATADPNNSITEFLETNNGPSAATTTVN
jgi:uncharacterized repeat protein (TIGR01451 family)